MAATVSDHLCPTWSMAKSNQEPRFRGIVYLQTTQVCCIHINLIVLFTVLMKNWHMLTPVWLLDIKLCKFAKTIITFSHKTTKICCLFQLYWMKLDYNELRVPNFGVQLLMNTQPGRTISMKYYVKSKKNLGVKNRLKLFLSRYCITIIVQLSGPAVFELLHSYKRYIIV